MNKKDFLNKLKNALNGLPENEIEERISFYGEMIDDRIEEGLTEEDAVKEIGDTEKIVFQIMQEIPLGNLVKEKIKPKRRLLWWEILLIILGFPIWFSVLAALFAVFLSVYVCIWSAIISLWAVMVSFIACAIGFFAAFILLTISGNNLSGFAFLSISLVMAGFSILGFFFANLCTKGLLIATKKFALGIKSLFVKKGE